MSSNGAAEGQKDNGHSRNDQTGRPTPDKTPTCASSLDMLPKALTVSPTDLFPEEQFESSDSEDDAELHAFTQRLDADWRSNLSQVLSWNARSPCTVAPSPSKESTRHRQVEDAVLGVHEPKLACGATNNAVESLCHHIETRVSLSTDNVTGQIERQDGQTQLDTGMSMLFWHRRWHFSYSGCLAWYSSMWILTMSTRS